MRLLRCSKYAVFYSSELVADGAACRKWYIRRSDFQKTDAQVDTVEKQRCEVLRKEGEGRGRERRFSPPNRRHRVTIIAPEAKEVIASHVEGRDRQLQDAVLRTYLLGYVP